MTEELKVIQEVYDFGNPYPNDYTSHPVHTKLPNAFGLYDMHGNVWEWCQDWWQADFYSQPGATALNPLCINSTSGVHVIRGGNWDYDARLCRSGYRSWLYPGFRFTYVGIRVVVSSSQ